MTSLTFIKREINALNRLISRIEKNKLNQEIIPHKRFYRIRKFTPSSTVKKPVKK